MAVVAMGGDGTTGESAACASDGRDARFRGCYCPRGSGADRVATAQVTVSGTCSCRCCVTGGRAGGSWRPLAAGAALLHPRPVGTGRTGGHVVAGVASGTSSRIGSVTGASRTWSAASRSGSCRCTVTGASRSERRHCCGPRATWSATGCTTMTGTGASATWTVTSGRAGPAARGAGCGAGRAGASQTPPGGLLLLLHPNDGDYGCSSCHDTRRPVQMAWLAECILHPTASESVVGPHSSQACLVAGPALGTGAGACWAGPGGAPVAGAACAAGEGGSCPPHPPTCPPRRCTEGSRPTGSHHPLAHSHRDVTGGDHSPRVDLTGGESLFPVVPWEAPTVHPGHRDLG